MDPSYKKKLVQQGYEFIGDHSALKICGWTKKSIRGEGTCYKEQFYGLKAHRCVQMSPVVNFCDHDCVFCWRERNNSPFTKIDDPKSILEKSPEGQKHQLIGFKGLDKADQKKVQEAFLPRHYAISLTGEPTYYPKMNEFIKLLKKDGLSSFLVSNGQLPKVIEKMEMPTQLYISLDAPTEELYKKIDRPMRKDGWQKLMQTLDVINKLTKENKTRTVIRITLIKEMNDSHLEEWAKLIERANPHFIEVKSYMFIGSSRQRLSIDNMPFPEEVVEFSEKLAELCNYEIAEFHKASRALLMQPKDKTKRVPQLIAFDEDGRLKD